MTEILLVLSNLSIGTLWGLLLMYITLSYLNWLRNDELSKFGVQKSTPVSPVSFEIYNSFLPQLA